MKKFILLLLTICSLGCFAQTGNYSSVDRWQLYAFAAPVTTNVKNTVLFFTDRVLTEEERDSLVYDVDFRKKCEWAIADYASYWISHNGAGLDDAARAKWRREYQLVRSVWRSDYVDPNLARRFVVLAKGMQFTLDNTPTVDEIITQFVINNKFDELASSYFDMLTQ